MALTSFSCPHRIIAHKSTIVMEPRSRIFIVKRSQFPLKNKATSTLVARSSLRNEVFENRSEGIICYVDDSGEIICEGYDEGPRFHQQLSRTPYNTRDVEIINLLQQRLLQIAHGDESKNGDVNGINIGVQDDLNWNGFNRFCR